MKKIFSLAQYSAETTKNYIVMFILSIKVNFSTVFVSFVLL